MKDHIIKNKFHEKPLFLVVDLNINSLDYSKNTHVNDVFNFVFDQPESTVIDHFITNTIIDSHVQSGIIKTDISDHFAIFSLIKTNLKQMNIKKTIIKKNMNEDSMKYFKVIFNSIDLDMFTQTLLTNDSYNIFLERFIKIYDQAFPGRKIEIKQKNLSIPWISKGLRELSKR